MMARQWIGVTKVLLLAFAAASSATSARWLAIVLSLALAAPAAASALTGYPPVVAPSAAAHAGDLGLQPCAFRSKGDGKTYLADCGRLVVPEDRRGARSRLIELPLIRIRATGPSPVEPIFTFQGGPGFS